jgi:hypothetical protein
MPGRRFGAGGPTRDWVRLAGAVALTALALACAWFAPTAAAAPDAIALSIGPGSPNGLTPITITASGSTSTASEQVIVIVSPAASGCPSSYANPPGGFWINQSAGAAPTPSFTVQSPAQHLEHGSYLACGWLVSASQTVQTQTAFTVANTDSLALAVSPATVTDGASATVSIHGVADVDSPEVFVTEKPASPGGCSFYPAADHGAPVPDFDPALESFGSFSGSALEYPGTGVGGQLDALPPGRYVLCGWLIDADGSSSVPLARAAPAYVTLLAPTGTLAYSVPELVSAGRRFAVTANISSSASDVSLYLDLKRPPANGSLCAASPALEPRGAKFVIDGGRAARITTHAHLDRGGVYVACAWLVWPHGTIDGPFPGRLIVVARRQHPVEYLGITSQRLKRRQLQSNYPISFSTIDGQIVNLSYFARYTCTKPGSRPTHPIYSTTFPAFAISSHHGFLEPFDQGTDRASIGGRLTSKRARGSFSESYTSGGYTCSSGSVTFTARRV